MKIRKDARGKSYQEARDRAQNIIYNYDYSSGKLVLDNYFLTDVSNKFRDQDVRITLYMPEGSVIYSDQSTRNYRRWRYTSDVISHGKENHYLRIKDNDVDCLDCENDTKSIEIQGDDASLEINKDKVEYKDEEVKATIDSSGISIKTNNN